MQLSTDRDGCIVVTGICAPLGTCLDSVQVAKFNDRVATSETPLRGTFSSGEDGTVLYFQPQTSVADWHELARQIQDFVGYYYHKQVVQYTDRTDNEHVLEPDGTCWLRRSGSTYYEGPGDVVGVEME